MDRQWTVDEDDAGARADVALARLLSVSRAEAQRLLNAGAVSLNGGPVRSSQKVHHGDVIRVSPTEPRASHLLSEPIPLDVRFEDADLLVLNKARGMVVHPAPGHSHGTLANAVLAHAGEMEGVGDEMRPGLIHRLDKDTSGLMVVAKTPEAYAALQSQMEERRIERTYVAAIWGNPSFREATIDACVGRHPSDRKRMAVLAEGTPGARKAVTHVRVLERLGGFSLVEARLDTGRTHQIRVHCLYIGHPVVGDPVYGGLRRVPDTSPHLARADAIRQHIERLNGQALHATRLAFDHPRTGRRLSFEVPPPDAVASLFALLRESCMSPCDGTLA